MGKNTQSSKPPDLLLPVVHDKAASDTAQLKGRASCFFWAFKSTKVSNAGRAAGQRSNEAVLCPFRLILIPHF